MLAASIIWAYTLMTAGLIGWVCWRLIAKASQVQGAVPLPFILKWLLGFAAVTTLASFFSLFSPLNLSAQAGILALTSLAFLAWLNDQKFRLWQWIKAGWETSPAAAVLTLLAAGTLLFLATSKPENFDTGLYHAQAIHWIETFPAVPGLANLHNRLGYNSSWLLSQALYSFGFLGGQSFHLNSSVLFLEAGIYFLAGLRNLLKGSHHFSDWVRALFFPLVFYILSSEVSSPGNDAPVALIIWVVLSEWLAYFEAGQLREDIRPLILTLISVYAITVKLSALPLVLVGLGFLAVQVYRRNWRMPLLAAGLSVLILLPWMARSVVQSGYLLYPFPTLDLFRLDWKVPPQSAQLDAEATQAWARIPGHELAQVQSMSFQTWTREWFLNQTFNRRLLLLAALAVPFGYLLLSLLPRLRPFLFKFFKCTWPVFSVVYIGLVFWFVAAPDFRFGMGFIMSGSVLAAASVCFYLHERWSAALRYLPRLLFGLLFLYQGFLFVSSIDAKTLNQRLVQPADYPSLPTQPCHVGSKTIMAASEIAYGQCWYGIFPCIPSCTSSFELRGADWQDGFRPKASLPAP